MIVYIENLLSQRELGRVRQTLEKVEFKDGRTTAGTRARARKNNLEFSAAGTPQQKLDEVVIGRLYAHPQCQALLPCKIARPYYARYETGMAYGDHTDDPIMGDDKHYRSDLAVTIFLGEREYQGGELVINTQTPSETRTIKGKPGDAVLYPATSMHRVEPVSDGVRLVAVTWIQSFVRDAYKRELIYHLGTLRAQIARQAQADKAIIQKADWLYTNLVRMWSEP